MFHYYYVLLRILATKSTKWMDPTRVNYLTSPQSEQTLRGLITRHVHKVDEPYKGWLLDKSTKWTDPTRVDY